MKYFIFALILILLVGCTTVVEETSKPKPADEKPVGGIIQQKPVEPIKTRTEDQPENNVIKIGTSKFEPDYVLFEDTSTVIWDNLDNRQHLIACYYTSGGRVFLGEKLEKGGKTQHTFKEHGTYICVDAIYGYRGTVVIYKNPEHLSPLTGAVIAAPKANIDPPIVWPAFLLVTLCIMFVYFHLIKSR